MDLLATRALAKSFGDNRAVDGVDFNVGQGEVLALVGANGAGKTTLVNLVSGLLRPDSGQILFAGEDVTPQSSYERIKTEAVRHAKQADHFVRENPYYAVGIAAGVGALIGLLVSRSGNRSA